MDLCGEETGRGRLGFCLGGFGGFLAVFSRCLAAVCVPGVGFRGC